MMTCRTCSASAPLIISSASTRTGCGSPAGRPTSWSGNSGSAAIGGRLQAVLALPQRRLEQCCFTNGARASCARSVRLAAVALEADEPPAFAFVVRAALLHHVRALRERLDGLVQRHALRLPAFELQLRLVQPGRRRALRVQVIEGLVGLRHVLDRRDLER